jgi:hypothetical protein
MNGIVKNIGVILLALVFVSASGGFAIYQHYCGCTNSYNTSLVAEGHTCQDDSEGNGSEDQLAGCCAHVPVAESCCTDEEYPSANSCPSGHPGSDQSSPASHDCCFTSTLFYQLDDYFGTTAENKPLRQFVLQTCITDFVTNPGLEELSISKNFFHSGDPPPLLSGKDRVLAYHQAKVAPPLS